MMKPNVMDITGPMRGDTSIAAVMLGALFSTRPRAAKELNDRKQISSMERISKNMAREILSKIGSKGFLRGKGI